MLRLSLLAALLLAACGSAPAAQATPGTPSPASPRATPSSSSTASLAAHVPYSYGVFVDGTLSAYSVLLIGTDGKTAAQAQASVPEVYRYTHFPPAPPFVSPTDSRVYFADGGSIKYLAADGSTGVAMAYPGGPKTAAGFAVSPDNRRIAVALLSFTSPDNVQVTLDLYVEDVGGGNRTELFASTSVAEWPIGWENGHIVIAVGSAVVGNASSNPYNGFQGYHIADAATGNRLVTMRSDCLYGPLELPSASHMWPSAIVNGTACWSSGAGIGAQRFDGSYRAFMASASDPNFLLLSPDGNRIAGRPAAQGSPMVLFDITGGASGPPAEATTTSLGVSGVPMGWIDDQHLVYYGPNGFGRAILDLTSRSVIPITACTCGNSGAFFGAIGLPS